MKTRLASSVGDQAASELYRACIALTLERLEALRDDATLYVDPPEALEATRAWLGEAWTIRPQQGTTLGDRLQHANDEIFGNGARYVVTIGTDSPWLSAEDIEEAFNALRISDVVLGPTEDGGYYLIGLSHPAPALFEGIAWSTSEVYEQTVAKARTLGLQVHPLRRGYDIDQLEDVERFLVEHPQSIIHDIIRRSPCRS